MTNAQIKVLLVDDHPIVREGLQALFAQEPEFNIVGEAGGRLDGGIAVAFAAVSI